MRVANTVPTVLVSRTERVKQSRCTLAGRFGWICSALRRTLVRDRDGRGLGQRVRHVLVISLSSQQPILVFMPITDFHNQPGVVATPLLALRMVTSSRHPFQWSGTMGLGQSEANRRIEGSCWRTSCGSGRRSGAARPISTAGIDGLGWCLPSGPHPSGIG